MTFGTKLTFQGDFMKSLLLNVLLFSATIPAFALENRTSELPWTDYPAHNLPTIQSFCDNTINNPKLIWGDRTTVSCSMKANGIVEITGRATNHDGVERSLTITADASHVMYMEESGDYVFKYKNDQGESLLLSTEFVHTKQKVTLFGVEEKGYYRGDLRLSKGETTVRVGYTDLE
jgi:hypothetical protein